MKTLLLITSISIAACTGFAQNEEDALRYSQTFFDGTARNTGMAGAMGAFGGDFSVVMQNPAGLARIRKSNFSATLNIENPSTISSFYGSTTKDNGLAGNFSNLSYVKAYELNPRKFNNWYSVQLGMGMTRVNSFQQRIQYTGAADSSIIHSFINEANGTPDSLIYDAFPFTSGLAYDVFAMDPAPGNQYVTDFTSGKAIHDRTITKKGGMNTYSFSVSGNYANKLYVGGAVNFTKVNYDESFEHIETYTDSSLWLQSINYTGDLEIEGWGYSARLGLIYLPLEWLSVGISGQLPTLYNLSDSWTNNMTARTDDGEKFIDPSFIPTGSYDYRITTPGRLNLSLGAVLTDIGSIGIDIEYVDYSRSNLESRRYNESPYSFNVENSQVQNIYQSALNYKIGFEGRINSQAYVRGGFAYYSSPFVSGKGNILSPTLFYTGGFGYNWGSVYADIAAVLRSDKSDYYAYDPTINGSGAQLDQRNLSFKFSIGFRLD